MGMAVSLLRNPLSNIEWCVSDILLLTGKFLPYYRRNQNMGGKTCQYTAYFLANNMTIKLYIMKTIQRIQIHVPREIAYLSMWDNFDMALPPGKVILDKGICGCGCTEYYLTNSQPIILVSPRKELINCKVKGKRERPLHYFKRSGTGAGTKEETIERLKNYLSNPSQTEGFVPKILVTYDSMNLVISVLSEWNLLNRFTIVVDEFTCLFTDAQIKGTKELGLLHQLNHLGNRIVYISATPIGDYYLQELDEFKDLPYVELIWDDSRKEEVVFVRKKMRNTRAEIRKVISDYWSHGYFKTKITSGFQVNSTEAVFFLNSVNDIVATIESCGLTPDDTLVICADDSKNRKMLENVGFTVGHVPGKEEYRIKNKTFTFVTKASFEGTDFYSDCSTTFIFADSNRDNLSLDISIDLPQIIGRCRTTSNPFRNEIYYFYKTSDTEHLDIEEEKKRIQKKMDMTERMIEDAKNLSDPDLLQMISSYQVSHKYEKGYIDAVELPDGTAKVVFNKLVYLADLRAVEIKAMQYKTTYAVLAYLEDNGFETYDQHGLNNDEISSFYNEFMLDGNFTRRMKLYTDTLLLYPNWKPKLEAIAEIPLSFKTYFNVIGAEKIRALSYKEAALERELSYIQSTGSISERLRHCMITNHVYSAAEIKGIIGNVYQILGLKATPKAVLIKDYIPEVIVARYYDEDGKRQQGYCIPENKEH